MENNYYEYESLWRFFADSVEKYGDSALFCKETDTVSYRDFKEDVLKLTHFFTGIKQKKIVILTVDPVRFAEAFFATVFSGHIACLFSPEYSVPEFLLDGYLFTDNEVISVFPSLVEIAEEPVITDPDAPRIVVLSSGTTGKTDGIVLSERNVLKNLYSILKFYYFSPGERLLHVLPYWHMFGLMGDLFMAACCGAAICLPVSGAGVLKAMRDFKPEIINMPPAMADMLCELIGKEGDVSAVTGGCLRRVMCAGAHLNEKTSDRLLGYGIKPLTAYGMTECSPCISVMPEGKLVRGTSGVLLDCWEIRLSDGNEILLRGDCVMLGYIDEAATKERIRDGWFHTGDIGSIDEEGYLTVSGRVNSLLVFSNGVKCFPERAEEKINLLPFILESRVAKVTDRIGDHPKLIIHTENEAGINREEVDRIMKEFRVFPYETEYTDSALPRNRLGKMIRE